MNKKYKIQNYECEIIRKQLLIQIKKSTGLRIILPVLIKCRLGDKCHITILVC